MPENEWAHLCVLGYVLNMVGPYNCANSVCKGWYACKKVYTDVKIERYYNLEMLFTHVSMSLVRNLDLEDYSVDIDGKILQKCKALRRLILNQCENFSKELAIIIPNLELLEEIDTGSCGGITNESVKELSKLPMLRKLRMVNNDKISVDDEGMRILCDMECLEELEVGKCENVTDEGMVMFGKIGRLKKLFFWECGIGKNGLKWAGGMRSLVHLEIDSCDNLTDEGMGVMGKMEWLEYLQIEMCEGVTNEGLKLLGGLRELRTLHIGGCDRFSDEGFICLLGMVRLERMSIRCHCLSNEEIKYVCGIKSLRRLELFGHSNVTDEGVVLLFGMEKLEKLELIRCKGITNEGIKMLDETSNLRELDICDCINIYDDELFLLQRLMRLEKLVLNNNTGVSLNLVNHSFTNFE